MDRRPLSRLNPDLRRRLEVAAEVTRAKLLDVHFAHVLELIHHARADMPADRALEIYARLHHLGDEDGEQLAKRVLARVGGRYSDEWHRAHLVNPRDVVPESNMPAYGWLVDAVVDERGTAGKMRALRTVGVPYSDADITGAADLVRGKTEMDALVAYLQGLGTASAYW